MNTTTIDTSTPDITLDSPQELVAAIPYLVGYVPHNAVVLVGLSDRLIAVTACAALPTVDDPADTIGITDDIVRQHGLNAAVLVGFGSPQRVTRCVDHVRSILAAENVDIIDAIRVTDDRFWSYLCQRPSCCPPEGTSVSGDPAIAAAFTLAGAQALPDRDAVIAAFAPVDPSRRDAATTAIRRVEADLAADDGLLPQRMILRAEATSTLIALRETKHLPPPDHIATLAVALTDSEVSADAIAFIDNEPRADTVDLWLWMLRHLDPPYSAMPAALLAYAAWRAGNGVIANEAAERAVSADPDCELAITMSRALAAGLPSSSMPKLERRAMARPPEPRPSARRPRRRRPEPRRHTAPTVADPGQSRTRSAPL